MWLLLLSVWFLTPLGVGGQQTGNHPDWDRWCGKVYQPGYPAFDPGGQTLPPPIPPGGPGLNVQFMPRYSLYLASESTGEFVVDAPLSPYSGKPWPNATTTTTSAATSTSTGAAQPSDWFVFSISLASDDSPLVQNRVRINTTGNVFSFDLSLLGAPTLEPVPIVLYGGPEDGDPTWTVTGELLYLPDGDDDNDNGGAGGKRGSVTKLDNLNGGMLFRNWATKGKFRPLFAYGFYASYDGFLRNVTRGTGGAGPLDKYAGFGLNGIVPLTNYGDSEDVFDVMDRMDLRFLFDMREFYKNLTTVEEQVLKARDADAIFAYWTADEPDGHQDPFEAPAKAYKLVRQLDPYHPVAVVLNCQDYYFGEYSAAADVLVPDVYPIGINATFSKWGTPCNATLGDCGCDNCRGTVGDVAARLDDLAAHERRLGRWPKTKLFSPQSFHGEGYWLRDPSSAEALVMSLLALNHGAQSLLSWVYPASDRLAQTHGALARVLSASPAVDFVVGAARPRRAAAIVSAGAASAASTGTDVLDVVDAAYWIVGGKALVSIANGGYVDIDQPVTVDIPGGGVATVGDTLWGDVHWELAGSQLAAARLPALSTSLLVVNLRDTTGEA